MKTNELDGLIAKRQDEARKCILRQAVAAANVLGEDMVLMALHRSAI